MNYKKLIIVTIAMAAVLSSCIVGPNFHPPIPPRQQYIGGKKPPATVSTKGHGGNSQQFQITKKISADWWNAFHSQALNKLVDVGIEHSHNIAAAQAALRQAQEILHADIGEYYLPQVDFDFNALRQRLSPATFNSTQLSNGVTFNLFSAQFKVNYLLDFFGKNHRLVEAQAAQVDYEYFLLQGTYLTLTSNIVTAAITEASLRAQIQATEKLVNLLQQQLQVTRKQYHLGGVSLTDVLAIQTQLNQTLATLPPLKKNLSQTQTELAVLIGDLPGIENLPIFNLDSLMLPEKLPLSLPSELVRQRPDIRAAEALLHQANAQVGVATANLFPQVTLSGAYGSQANTIQDLFTNNAKAWNIAADILQPVFHGGALHAQRRAAIAAFQQALAQYRETLIEAFKNVTDVLRALQYDALTMQAQTEAERSAKKTYLLAQGQYHLGAISYLNLLDAERQYQQTLIARIQAEALRYTDTAALFQALGGGWWNVAPCQKSSSS